MFIHFIVPSEDKLHKRIKAASHALRKEKEIKSASSIANIFVYDQWSFSSLLLPLTYHNLLLSSQKRDTEIY